MGKTKGNAFEREICKRLSLWWTIGYREDVFWRTSNSGGRATVRSKVQKRTKNQYGDICCTDSIGEPFLKMFTIELKKGYNSDTIQDILDKPPDGAKSRYADWIEKISNESALSLSAFWLIIVKRDRREPLVLYPSEVDPDKGMTGVSAEICFNLSERILFVSVSLLKDFLNFLNPVTIKEMFGDLV